MKKLLLSIFTVSFVFSASPKEPTGADVLALARSNLPSGPIKLSGTVQTETKSRKKITLPVEIELNYKVDHPSGTYRIGKPGQPGYQWLTVIWRAGRPDYIFSNPANQPSSTIPGTNITWQELSFSFLWWPKAKLTGDEKKNGRKYYIVNVPVPGAENTMRLWIDEKEGILQKTRTLDRQQQELSRLKVISTKKKKR